MTGVRDQQYLCDGLAEELTNTLSGVPGLRVIARTSAFAFRGAATDIREIGRQLGASRIVEGAVQRVDERLRITVQLIDTADACHVWSRRFDCPAADLFAIEDEIARAVAAEFTSGLPRGGEWSMRRHSRDAEAHDLYLRGLYIAARRTGPALREAAVHYQRAIERDPTYAVAHAALAECHGLTAFFGQVAPADGFPRARAAAEAALRLDPTVAEGHTALAAYRTFYEWKWDEAEQGFRRAITLNPSYPLGRMLYSHLLAITGRAQEAWEQAEAALRIDPWSLTVRVTIGLRLGEVRMFDRALDRLEATLAMDPTFALARLHIGRIHLVLGRYEEALTQFRAIADEFPLALAYLGNALGRLGRTGEAADILQKLKRMSASRYVGALPVALIHQGLGNFDAALDWYAKAFDAHDGVVAFSSVDPIVDELRGDPRFDALVRRLRLPSAPATDRSATVTPESSRS
jgi:TolB-like protein/Tfp pilus assembly protein PilF